jgi:hypothetical protein
VQRKNGAKDPPLQQREGRVPTGSDLAEIGVQLFNARDQQC